MTAEKQRGTYQFLFKKMGESEWWFAPWVLTKANTDDNTNPGLTIVEADSVVASLLRDGLLIESRLKVPGEILYHLNQTKEREWKQLIKKRKSWPFDKKFTLIGTLIALAGISWEIFIWYNPAPSSAKDGTTLIKTYDERFDNMTAKRATAGVVMLEYLSKTNWDMVTNNTDGLDDVLSFFDGMGYDMEQKKLSPNDVYEYFCDNILAYYQNSEGYIYKIQTNDPTELVNLKPLYDTMRILAAEQPPKTTPDEIYFIKPELIKIFDTETNSVNLK